MSLPHSKSRIDRAGDALRAHQSGQAPLTYDELVEELAIVEGFRTAHAAPLTRVAANLRYYVGEASGGALVVGQRLKRMATIRDKLEREPDMSLSRMHDQADAAPSCPVRPQSTRSSVGCASSGGGSSLRGRGTTSTTPSPMDIERSTWSPARTAC